MQVGDYEGVGFREVVGGGGGGMGVGGLYVSMWVRFV